MFNFKNFIFLFFGVIGVTIFIFNQSYQTALSDYAINNDDFGRVLGASENYNNDIPVKNYLTTESIKKIIPIVNKSHFAPLKKEGSIKPNLSWGSIVALDDVSEEVLFARNEHQQRSIASITKLITALTLMDMDIDWDSEYEIQSSDRVEGGRIYLQIGDKVILRDLLYVSLVASANTATKALVSASGISYVDFVDKMNTKVKSLGLEKTRLVDPIGLSSHNVSTALEVAKLIKIVLDNSVIKNCVLTEKYVFKTIDGHSKTVKSTDLLLDDFQVSDIKILGGKTGFTGAAGYCFAGMFSGQGNHRVVTVVLGSRTHSSRFTDTKKLINWVYYNYEWRH